MDYLAGRQRDSTPRALFASIDPNDLIVINTTTNQSFSAQSIAYDSATNTATWILSRPGGLLTDGEYVATLPAGAVSASGQTLAPEVTVEFSSSPVMPIATGR